MKSLVLRSLFCLFALSVPFAEEAFGQEVIPILSCVRFSETDLTVTAYFGYSSSFQTPVHIDITDENNFFTPGEDFRGQPTDFLPGLHQNVFATSFRLDSSLPEITWILSGHTASANSDLSMACDPPRYLGLWNSSTVYQQFQAVSHNGVVWVSTFPGLPFSGHEPGTHSFWRLFLLRGRQGPQGDTGQPGQSVTSVPEPPGSNCSSGGVKYTDISGVRYVCNGAPGPQGPPGNPNIFPSGQVYTFPSNGRLTIIDSNVTPTSIIVLQYVGGGVAPPLSPNPILISTAAGQFTASGVVNKQFRYVVIN